MRGGGLGGGSLWRERRQARPGEAQEPSCGAAKGGCGPYGAVAPMDGTTAVRDPYCLDPIAWPLLPGPYGWPLLPGPYCWPLLPGPYGWTLVMAPMGGPYC